MAEQEEETIIQHSSHIPNLTKYAMSMYYTSNAVNQPSLDLDGIN